MYQEQRYYTTAITMRRIVSWTSCWLCAVVVGACVDPVSVDSQQQNDILIVDGTITNLAEPQRIRINRSVADRLTGRFGTLPVTKATVDVVTDSAQVSVATETTDGTYQLPADFRGQVGHAYQLRFTLSDGSRYVSTQQVMQPVPPISQVTAQFSNTSLPTGQLNGYRAGHTLNVQSQDPAGQHNYYRWDWLLYERQYWCRSCVQGVYSVYKILPNIYKDRDYFVTGDEVYEDCFNPPAGQASYDAPDVPKDYWIYDYPCRSACWQILRGYTINVFDDLYSNGGIISRQSVAQIPFYAPQPALVDIRQLSLTADAYRYYKLFADQTQTTGGLADTPPTALVGNVRSTTGNPLAVVGYFTASAVSLVHYWLDRKDTQGVSFGATDPAGAPSGTGDALFYALNLRRPMAEPPPPYQGGRDVPKIRLWPTTDRPPTAPCLLSDNRTPFKPEGWRD